MASPPTGVKIDNFLPGQRRGNESRASSEIEGVRDLVEPVGEQVSVEVQCHNCRFVSDMRVIPSVVGQSW